MNNHAEICPICKGTGKDKEYPNYPNYSNFVIPFETTCRGCNGKGWITVTDKGSGRLWK